jgi:hypothetical protein
MHRLLIPLLLTVCFANKSQAQAFSWDLDSYHSYSTFIHLEFSSNGLAIGEDNSRATVRNLSSSTISFGVKFLIKDFCGNTTTEYWAGGVTLKPGEEEKEIYSVTNRCKEVKKDGNSSTGIASVTCQVMNFKNITQLENNLKAEQKKKDDDREKQQLADAAKQKQQTQAPSSYYSSQTTRTSNSGTTTSAPAKPTWQETNERIRQENQRAYEQQQARIAAQEKSNKEFSDKFVSDASELVGMVGNIIAQNKRDKEKKEMRKQEEARALQQQREDAARERAELQRFLAQRRDLRNSLMTDYSDGGVPLSSQNIGTNELFYFTYVFDKQKISDSKPAIQVSNVFSVFQYSDGTWPFKTAIQTDIKKFAPTGAVTLVGYYTTKEMAEEERKNFLAAAGETSFEITEFVYKGKAKPAATDGDFWGNKPASKTDSTAKSATLRMAKGDEDFWETGQMKKKDGEDKKKEDAKKEEEKKKAAQKNFWNN